MSAFQPEPFPDPSPEAVAILQSASILEFKCPLCLCLLLPERIDNRPWCFRHPDCPVSFAYFRIDAIFENNVSPENIQFQTKRHRITINFNTRCTYILNLASDSTDQGIRCIESIVRFDFQDLQTVETKIQTLLTFA